MALFSGIFGILGRFAGRFLNSTLGWATILLFGRVSARRQTILLLIGLASIIWVVLVLGVLLPAVGVFLLAALPIPAFIDQTWIRAGMLLGGLFLPLLVGMAAVFVSEESHRPRRGGIVVAVLRGYPFTLLLAFTIAFLAVVALIRKLRSIAARRVEAHVPLIVKPGRYDEVVGDLEGVLQRADIPARRTPAPEVLSLPPKLLARIAGPSLGSLVPDRLILLKAPDLEILVYPSDLAMSGAKATVTRARTAVAVQLTHSPAYLTTTAEAEQVEDRIRAIGEATDEPDGSHHSSAELRARLDALDRTLSGLDIEFDEWETLYRERLQVERDLLTGGRNGQPALSATTSAPPAEVALGLTGIGLVALDLAMLVVNRVRLRSHARR